MQINHIKYIQKSKAGGKLKQLYKCIEINFGKLAEPFVLHSLNEELTVGVWAILFETVLVEGKVKRSLKEAIATSVSEINECSYCVDAHSIMIFGTEKGLQKNISNLKNGKTEPRSEEEKTILWALKNLDFDSPIILNPPFNKEEAPEIIGTAVLFHYINRMVTLFAGDTPLPTTKMRGLVLNIASAFIFAKAIRKEKRAGESLAFIDEDLNQEVFDWADASPNINKAFQYLKQQSENNIDQILSPELITSLIKLSTKYGLIQTEFGNENLKHFLKSVISSEREIAEFFYLTMFEAHKVRKKHFQTLKQKFKDEEILKVAAFVSWLVAENIGERLFLNVKK
jgi:alkylhydroperoxidase family enzyme